MPFRIQNVFTGKHRDDEPSQASPPGTRGIRSFMRKSAYVFWFAAFGLAALLTVDIYRKIWKASAVNSDTVEFTLSQTELELNRLIDALREAAAGEVDINDVRVTFDVLYSRVMIISDGVAYKKAQQRKPFKESLAAARDFLTKYTVEVDGDDERLRKSLPVFLEDAKDLQKPIRQLVLDGLAHFTDETVSERQSTQAALVRLALLVTMLFLTLTIFLLGLLRARNISRASAQEARLIASRLDKILATSLGAIITTNRDGKVIQVNNVVEKVFGYSASEMIGQAVTDLIVPERHRVAHHDGMARVAKDKSYRVVGKGAVEMEAKHRDGRVFPIEMSLDVAEDDEGELFYIAYLHDISDRVEKQKLLDAQHEALVAEAYWDRLTGAMRRTRMQELYGVSSRRTDYWFAVFDVDDFKSINTMYGHAAGDSVLSQIAAILAASIPEAEAFCRYGGEEFVALIPVEKVNGDPSAFLDRILYDVQETEITVGSETLRCTLSAGFALLEKKANMSITAVQADTALRFAKSIGKNCAVEATPDLLSELGYTANPPSRAMVIDALKDGRICYHLQPVVELRSSNVVGYEALLRWNEEDGRPVPLPAFLSMYTSIARDQQALPWLHDMLRRSLPSARQLSDKNAYISFNFEAYDLLFDFERNALTLAILELSSEGYQVCIEMLENSHGRVISDERIGFLLSKLRDYGFELFLDDFGKEAASLDRLGNYDFTSIKLDRSLVSGLESSEKKRRIIQLVVQLAKYSNLKVIAEGIESEAELATLMRLGVSYGQGYLLGRPNPKSHYFAS